MAKKLKIEKGDTYNNLSYTGNKLNGAFEFQCVCGVKKYWRTVSSIMSGRVKSCGCKQLPIRSIKGKVFSYLTATGNYVVRNTKSYAECLCVCGKLHFSRYDALKSGIVKSCGCKKDELSAEAQVTHGLSRVNKTHSLYKVWCSIKSRCYHIKDRGYKYYGARGIRMCDEWKNNFIIFYNWAISNGWEKGLTIDRLEVNCNYEPSNCRFATFYEQNRNKRNNINITAFGETKCLMDWSLDERCKVSYGGLKRRIVEEDWDAETSITKLPVILFENKYSKNKK